MDSETDGTKKTQKIGIIGAGAWGSAIAKVLADKGYQVEIWCYEPEIVAQINSIPTEMPSAPFEEAYRQTHYL